MQSTVTQPCACSPAGRLLGRPGSPVIYFLPWGTPFWLAKAVGLLPLPFIACYETPADAVNADPVRSAVIFREIIADATGLIAEQNRKTPPLIIGFSLGTVAATAVANAFSAPLLSICGAARGEDMIWDSPSAAAVKDRAEKSGYRRAHFYSALSPLNPIENLDHLDQRSLFLVAAQDRIIPAQHRLAWQRLLHRRRPRARVLSTPLGHLPAIVLSRRLQQAWVRSCTALDLPAAPLGSRVRASTTDGPLAAIYSAHPD